MKEGDLRVWWCPQVPCEAFHVPVDTPDEAAKILGILAGYDAFQLENLIKPDYTNVGGLEVFEPDENNKLEWCEWVDSHGYSIMERPDDESPATAEPTGQGGQHE